MTQGSLAVGRMLGLDLLDQVEQALVLLVERPCLHLLRPHVQERHLLGAHQKGLDALPYTATRCPGDTSSVDKKKDKTLQAAEQVEDKTRRHRATDAVACSNKT